jgi:perosamine synthetase
MPDLPGPDPEVSPCRIPGTRDKERIIPVADVLIDGREKEYVADCMARGWISSAGRYVKDFENSFAEAVGCRDGVACSSGTAALHLALAASGLGPGDEVVLPAFTMIATANAVSYTGATPVLVDSEPETGNIDISGIEDKITEATRAIVPVHVYGHPAEMNEINALASAKGIQVIEDAAEAHGAVYQGRPCGSLGHAACFSFYANKIITTGEGGMVTSDDTEWLKRVRYLRDHAFSPERHFWHHDIGFNYRMTNLQAAVGLGQTQRLPALVEIRRHHASRYNEQLADIPGLLTPSEYPHVQSVYWMYGIRVAPPFPLSRNQLRARLAARGIETRTFFVPLHYQPAWFSRFQGQRFPVAEQLCRTGLYLPSGPSLKDKEIKYICNSIRDICKETGPARP